MAHGPKRGDRSAVQSHGSGRPALRRIGVRRADRAHRARQRNRYAGRRPAPVRLLRRTRRGARPLSRCSRARGRRGLTTCARACAARCARCSITCSRARRGGRNRPRASRAARTRCDVGDASRLPRLGWSAGRSIDGVRRLLDASGGGVRRLSGGGVRLIGRRRRGVRTRAHQRSPDWISARVAPELEPARWGPVGAARSRARAGQDRAPARAKRRGHGRMCRGSRPRRQARAQRQRVKVAQASWSGRPFRIRFSSALATATGSLSSPSARRAARHAEPRDAAAGARSSSGHPARGNSCSSSARAG